MRINRRGKDGRRSALGRNSGCIRGPAARLGGDFLLQFLELGSYGAAHVGTVTICGALEMRRHGSLGLSPDGGCRIALL